MQFVANGPHVPDHLLQAHEEDRVVFFCGAGISYPAGLPGFEGLVDSIYSRLDTSLNAQERAVYKGGRYDAALDLLEHRIPGQRLAVRRELKRALTRKTWPSGALATHLALLRLARTRDGTRRLVTTNFDRLFEIALSRSGQRSAKYVAPTLPIPKASRWNGLVYLHGLLPAKDDNSALHRLVLTSGDFGLAYLTERWAARFVADLFQNYIVCFIGYSINDSVLRYMMDALAADRMMGEATPPAYAFDGYLPDQHEIKKAEWKAKHVIPILYHVDAGSNNRDALHKTLREWSLTYRDGVLGRERVVVDYALTQPSASSRQDDFVGRMLWALSDPSGRPAKQFAEFSPVPPLEWLKEFESRRYRHADLNRFGVPPHAEEDPALTFSIVNRPASYRQAPWMLLLQSQPSSSHWDAMMSQLARWLTRYLNAPALLLWVAEHGGRLHQSWARIIEEELSRISQLEKEAKAAELQKIRQESPEAVPDPSMRRLWRLVLAGRVGYLWPRSTLYRWLEALQEDQLGATHRFGLRQLLQPQILLREAFLPYLTNGEVGKDPRTNSELDPEVVLATENARAALQTSGGTWKIRTLWYFLEDFQNLTLDALNILKEIGKADHYDDQSYWKLPSIEPHRQNRPHRSWLTVVELLRDAWLEILERDRNRASQIAISWFELPYPVFKRLALFAASQDDCIDEARWMDWLLVDNSWCLWSVATQRETMRLISLQGGRLPPPAQQRLETAILAGPPRTMFRDDLTPDDWKNEVEHSMWHLLAKLDASGLALSTLAEERFAALSRTNPHWRLATDEHDEFAVWMSDGSDAGHERIEFAPRERRGLVQWLQLAPPEDRLFYRDDWKDICRNRLSLAFTALCSLAGGNIWPIERWRETLQVWSEKEMAPRSWRYAAPLASDMPADVLEALSYSIAYWLKNVSKLTDRHENTLLDLCARILSLPLDSFSGITKSGEPLDEPVTDAVNHPVGHITLALLDVWIKRRPSDDDGLPGDLDQLFTQLCDIDNERFRHARLILASRVITLFRVDENWTKMHLLPLFNWESNQIEARAAWKGFLWSPRIHSPLMNAFRSAFLDTANHYEQLDRHSGQFAALLTYCALEPPGRLLSSRFPTRYRGTAPRGS